MKRLLFLSLSLGVLVGCATTGGGGQNLVSREDSYFLLVPTEGYPMTVDSSARQRLDRAYSDLLEKGDRKAASEVSIELLARDPNLAPARVLKAQVFFVESRYEQILSELLPIVEEYPAYTAAQLVYGRASERAGELVEALRAYRSVSAKSPLARSRSLDIESRAVVVIADRIEEELAKGHVEEATDELERLQEWAPEADRTLELTASVARAREDFNAELLALRRLSRHRPDDQAVLERRAELELELGDPAAGMRLLEDAVARDPNNQELSEALVDARFAWRLQLLPPEARELARSSELTRGEFATLLYWLFPEIRYGRGGGAKIANDVLQHPHREQIVKVANSGVMDVDASLHRFEPYRALLGSEALTAMLRLLSSSEPPLPCLSGTRVPRSSLETCRVSTACGLIAAQVDCLPTMTVGGAEALRLIQLTQELLGAQ